MPLDLLDRTHAQSSGGGSAQDIDAGAGGQNPGAQMQSQELLGQETQAPQSPAAAQSQELLSQKPVQFKKEGEGSGGGGAPAQGQETPTLQADCFKSVSVFSDVLAGKAALRYGASDTEAVEVLQSVLNGLGFECGAPDGQWGPGTQRGMCGFQGSAGLNPDGVLGKMSMGALDSAASANPGVATVTKAKTENTPPEKKKAAPPPDDPQTEKKAEEKPTEKPKEEAPPEKAKEEAPPEKVKEETPPPQSDIEERARLDAAGKTALAALPKTSAADSAKTPGNVGQGDAEAGSHLPGWFMEIQNRLVASTVWGAPQEEAQNAIRDFAMFLARTTGDGKVPAHLKVFFDYIGRGTKNDRSARQEGYKSTADLTGAEGARNWCAGAAHRAKAIAKTEGRKALLEHLASLGLKPICIPAVFFHNLEVRSGASKAKSFYGTAAYSEPLEPGDRIDYLFDGCQYGGHAVNVVADLGGSFLHVSGNTTKHSAVGIGQANRLLQKPPNLNLTTATDIRSAQTKQKASAHISTVSFGGGKLVYMIQRMTDPHKALEMLETEDPAQFAKACKTLLLKKV